MYYLKYSQENGVATFYSHSSNFTHSIHLITNFPNYKHVNPLHFLKENRDTKYIIEYKGALPPGLLDEKWKLGNFISDNQHRYHRLSQYDFDKRCYEDVILSEAYPDNARLFKYMGEKLVLQPRVNQVIQYS